MASPSFLLAGHQDVLIARGIAGTLPASATPLAERAAAWLHAHRSDGAPLLVGALPFDKARPGHLYQPRSIERMPRAVALAALEGNHPVAPPSSWSVLAEPSREEYAAQVACALLQLRGTEAPLRKIVLARTLRLIADRVIDPDALFTRLARDPLVNAFLVTLHDGTLDARRPSFVGATPELLIEKRGNRIASCPLAGSAPRAACAAGDEATVAALLDSTKDRREHATVVEWIADVLAPYCRTLSVPAVPSAIATATMWHLGTRIEGDLRDGDTPVIALAEALHPTPAIAGVPHRRALDLIDMLEDFDRGYFTGAVGWTDPRGDGRWLVAIRCALLDGAEARLYAGAGIVADSEPEREADETSAKFRAMLDALGVDETGRASLAREAA